METEHVNSAIKHELPDSEYGDNISNSDTTSIAFSIKRECRDHVDSKDFNLLKPVKLELSLVSELESQEEILPDLAGTSLTVNDEYTSLTMNDKKTNENEVILMEDRGKSKTISIKNIEKREHIIYNSSNRCKSLQNKSLTTKPKPGRKYKHICILCNKVFPRKGILKEHKATKCSTVRLFSCDFCSKGFISKKYMDYHKRKFCTTIYNKIKLSCNLCGKHFNWISSLNKHKRDVHLKFSKKMNLTFSCEMCQKVYKNKQGLDRHKLDSHSDEQFECGHCSNVFSSKNILKRHIQSVHLPTVSQCSECCKVFLSAETLKRHVLSIHSKSKVQSVPCETRVSPGPDLTEPYSQKLDENVKNSGDFSGKLDEHVISVKITCSGDIFCDCNSCEAFRNTLLHTTLPKIEKINKHVCSLCYKIFSKKGELKQHIASKCNTLKLFFCDHCTKGFTTKRYSENHKRKCCTMSVDKNQNESKLGCDLCDRYFTGNSSLYRHKREVHFNFLMNLTFTCDICQKVYKHKKGLARHKSNSHSDEQFECGHCSKVYQSKRILQTHIHSVHFPHSVLKCSKCTKVYATAIGLTFHNQTAHSKPSLVCETCGKSFFLKHRLHEHMLIHTGEKPFMCLVCGKNFRTEANLHQHSRTHSDKRPYSCGICLKAFRIKHHLRQHMAVHGMDNTSVRRKHQSN